MTGPEARVEDYLRDYFKQRGWIVYKMDQGGGVADRLLISPLGFHLWVELKRPGKTELDPAQIAWRDNMIDRLTSGHKTGIAVRLINSHSEVRQLYQSFCEAR